MKSLETQLAESLDSMNVLQKDSFWKRRIEKAPIESHIALAKECLKESYGRIKRNNGSQAADQESRESVMQQTDAVLFEGMAKCRSTAKGIENVVEVNGQYQLKSEDSGSQLTESQRQDYEFAKLIGLSEAEARKVALSNCIRD